MTPIPLPVLGIDMLSDETQMPAGTVRAAVNVDIDRAGQPRRRQGRSLAISGTDIGSLRKWGGALIAVSGTQVVSIDPATLAVTPLYTLQAHGDADYTEYNGDLYLATAYELLRLRAGVVAPAGVRLPAALPDVGPHSAGSLTPGQYTVAVSVVDAGGEESPAKIIGRVHTGAGLMLTGIPAGHTWRVYLSPPDGDALYLSEEFTSFMPQHVLGGYPLGAPCQTLHLQPMPGGHLVRAWGGRMFVARGDTLWYSEPLLPHLVAPRRGFIPFVGRIRLLEFVDGGAFVGDERGVWWLGGSDPTQYTTQLASEAVPVAMSGITAAAHELGVAGGTSKTALWLSSHGYMLGAPGGQVTALNADRIRLAPEISGRTALITRDGTTQVITLTAAPGPASVFGLAIDTQPQ